MKKFIMIITSTLIASLALTGFLVQTSSAAPAQETSGCREKGFLGFPTWYKYLDPVTVKDPLSGADVCQVKLHGLKDIWLVVAAAIDILLRVASMIAIGFIIYGGVSYVISQGSPDKTKKSQDTVINAVIGLAISVVAAAVVGFIAGRF